jgi:glycosyltransferase involved in cell wall biosynthesis
VPTIGYRGSGGLTDSIVDGVTGLLVEDPERLVDALRRLLSDPVLREELGAKARIRSAEFSWPLSARAMRTVLDEVARGRRVSASSDANSLPFCNRM